MQGSAGTGLTATCLPRGTRFLPNAYRGAAACRTSCRVKREAREMAAASAACGKAGTNAAHAVALRGQGEAGGGGDGSRRRHLQESKNKTHAVSLQRGSEAEGREMAAASAACRKAGTSAAHAVALQVQGEAGRGRWQPPAPPVGKQEQVLRTL